MAGAPGFEPRLTESESAVLPLNYAPPNALILHVFLVVLQIRTDRFTNRLRMTRFHSVIEPGRLLPFDHFQTLPPIGVDAHLIFESHVMIDHLTRHPVEALHPPCQDPGSAQPMNGRALHIIGVDFPFVFLDLFFEPLPPLRT
jgi:hypothetical protein